MVGSSDFGGVVLARHFALKSEEKKCADLGFMMKPRGERKILGEFLAVLAVSTNPL